MPCGIWNWPSGRYEVPLGLSMGARLTTLWIPYIAGADIGGVKLENYAKSFGRSNKMLILLNSAVGILRGKHKHGGQYY